MRTNRFTAILRILAACGPLTPRQIADKMGVPYRALYGNVSYLKVMTDEGLVHVLDWDRQEGHGGPPIPIYVAGAGENAPKPKSLLQVRKDDAKVRARRKTKAPRVKKTRPVPSELSFLLGLK